jgi:hypothetical protein
VSDAAPRYLPHRALPPYAFVPGAHPHPTRDPAGHSYGDDRPVSADDFAWGADLYNAGYFWEAHEAWEGLWLAAPATSCRKTVLQGLIQCAAACLKVRVGSASGASKLTERGVEHLRAGAGDAALAVELGLDVQGFAAAFAAWMAAGPSSVTGRPTLVLERSRRR